MFAYCCQYFITSITYNIVLKMILIFVMVPCTLKILELSLVMYKFKTIINNLKKNCGRVCYAFIITVVLKHNGMFINLKCLI